MINSPALLSTLSKRLRTLKEAEKYEENFLDFVEYVWSIVEPSRDFVRGWVQEAIGEHLEAVTDGHIKRLLINVPPGFAKSLLTDVFWPAWEWGPRNRPALRYVCFSYSNYLTERDNMRCRNVVLSDRYQKLWGKRVTVSSEQFTKVKFANKETGWKFATSVSGIGVGERGDRLIIDDPNNTIDMDSEATRRNTSTWFTEVVPTRLNSQMESAIVVIQQRLHEEDVSGVILSKDLGYTHLCIPMEYDTRRVMVNGWDGDAIKTFVNQDAEKFLNEQGYDQVFWTDPRSEEAELAWSDLFPREVVDRLKHNMGPVASAGQFQQIPVPRGGTIIKKDYWKLWDEPNAPPLEYVLASLDTAYTEKETNDPSALTVWGVFRDKVERPVEIDRMGNMVGVDRLGSPKIILLYAWRERLAFSDLIQRVIETCQPGAQKGKKHHRPCFPVDRLLIESKAAGISLSQELTRVLGFTARFGLELIDHRKHGGGDKVARVNSVEHMFSQGMIYAPERSFADMVIDEMATFPFGSHDDLTDSTSMALRYLRDMNFALHPEEWSEQERDEMMHRPKLQPIYDV